MMYQGNDLRALTLIRPMGQAIVYGSKRIENRPRNLPRGMLGKRTIVAVHSGKGLDMEYVEAIRSIDGDDYKHRFNDDSAIIGLMLLSGRVYTHDDLCSEEQSWWYVGPFGYEVADAVAFPHVIRCSGMLGFWRVKSKTQAWEQLKSILCSACGWYHPKGQPIRHCVLR